MQEVTNKRAILADPEYADHSHVFLHLGIKRSMLFSLAAAGNIKAVSLKRPGASRGARLFHIGSIRAFLEECSKR